LQLLEFREAKAVELDFGHEVSLKYLLAVFSGTLARLSAQDKCLVELPRP
jgi:hypothetical protein